MCQELVGDQFGAFPKAHERIDLMQWRMQTDETAEAVEVPALDAPEIVMNPME